MSFYKINLLFLFIFLAAVGQVFGQFEEQFKKFNAKTKFENVFKTLTEKPQWLFGEDICPFNIIPGFETKVEYLSEGCADDAQICLDKCKENDGNACYSLALLVQDEKGLEQDYSEALFLRACKLGVLSGCTNRAAHILNLQADDEKAVICAGNTFEKTCEKKDPWGCTMFARILYYGLGRPKNSEKALRVMSQSCKNGDEDEACKAAKELTEEIKRSQQKDKK